MSAPTDLPVRTDDRYLAFIATTVVELNRIKANPTTAQIENLIIDLQALTLDQTNA